MSRLETSNLLSSIVAALVGMVFFTLLSGCGAYDSIARPTDFAIVTEGEAGGMAAMATGNAELCKVTTHGEVKAWRVSYEGTRCEAQLNGGVTYEVENDDTDAAQ